MDTILPNDSKAHICFFIFMKSVLTKLFYENVFM